MADQLHLDGKEMKLILAAEDFYTLHHCKQTQEDEMMDQDGRSRDLVNISDQNAFFS